jgi:hypothetical protein
VGLLKLPHTAGIVALSFVCYASFITLRGLWLGPLLIERHHFSLVQSGNVALAVSAVSMVGPALFGRFDPGGSARRRRLVGFSLLLAGLFVVLALSRSAAVDVGLSLAVGLLSGYMILQYSEVRSAYPAAIVGRALGLLTMAMFLGVAAMQWFTGLVAELALAHGADLFMTVMLTIAALLAAGALAFAVLPKAA